MVNDANLNELRDEEDTSLLGNEFLKGASLFRNKKLRICMYH